MKLFVYGTLMDDARVAELTGQRFRKQPAALRGYRRLPSGHGYPYVVPEAGGVVDGFLLRDVTAEALRAFDRYEEEGRYYRRTEVEVEVAGRRESAMTYVGIAAQLTRPARDD